MLCGEVKSSAACRIRTKSVAFIAALVVALSLESADRAQGSLWPLHRYKPCGNQVALGDGEIWQEPDVAFEEELAFLWLTAGPRIMRLRYPEITPLGSTLTIGSDMDNNRTSMAVTRLSSTRAAVIDRVSPQITVIELDGEEMVQGEVIPLSFVPHSISWDAPFKVFVATSVNDKRTVIEVDQFGKITETLFTLNDDEFPGVEISNIHYASTTGTIFILCTPCNEVFEVQYFTGRLKDPQARAQVDESMANPTGLSIARTGSPLFLVDSSLQLLQMCQKILPPVPVLPLEQHRRVSDQTWFPLDTYSACGEIQLEQVTGNGPGVQAMAIAPDTRTVWAWVGGRLSEYTLDGKLLRSLAHDTLKALEISGVTSMAWVRSNELILGMTKGNRIAHIDVAPAPPIGDSGGGYVEPPGPEEELRLIRKRNLVELVSMHRVPKAMLPKDSLGPISYHRARKTAVIASSDGFFERYLEIPIQGQGKASNISMPGIAISATLVRNDGDMLLWCPSCAQLFEVSPALGASIQDRVFHEFTIDTPALSTVMASTFAMTPEGALLLFASLAGQVSFFCSSGVRTESGLVQHVKTGTFPDVDHVYYWRTVEIQLGLASEQESDPNSPERSLDGDLYVQLFGTKCLDPVLQTKNIVSQVNCEQACSQSEECKAYSYDFEAESCKLLESCEDQAVSYRDSSAIKSEDFPKPPISPENPSYSYLLRSQCSGPVIKKVASVDDLAGCEALCSTDDETCKAFTFNFKGNVCTLYRWCDFPLNFNNGISARKVSEGSKAPEYTFKYLPMVACLDEPLEVLTDLSADACQNACSDSTDCGAFYINKQSVCELKQSCRLLEPRLRGLSGIKA